jgi:ABC-type lipoprotein release transport system permease subunit
VAAILIASAIAASLVPAFRAASTDPMLALRHE